MNSALAHDLLNIDQLLQHTRDYAVETLVGLEQRPVAVPPPPQHLQALRTPHLPDQGIGYNNALADFQTRWAPGFSASAGPRYLGFVTGGATPAALAGDWLTSTFDQNPTSALDSSAPDLERETIGWLRDLFGLSEQHEGCFVTGATMSNTVGLAIAREWLGELKGVRISEQGVAALGPVKVLSASPHSSILKALSMLGLGRGAVEKIACMEGREAIDVAALETALIAQNGVPCIVVANSGTVNTVDFDDLSAIVALKRRYRFWLHVDGAFGSFAALLPAYAHLVANLDDADSICIDCHKWLNVPYDSAVQFTLRRDLQVRVFQNSAAYLGLLTDNPDFVHLTPENSRRLRALPSWFALASYGRAGQRDIVERNIAAASTLGQRIATEPRLSLLAPVRMNVVCFTLASDRSEASITAFLKRLSDSGEVFLSPTVLNASWGVRAAFSNWRTTEHDVERTFDAIQRALG